jgi:hypothetical protein
MADERICEEFPGIIMKTGNWNTWRKPHPKFTLSTTNPTRNGRKSNPELRDERSAKNCLSLETEKSNPVKFSMCVYLGSTDRIVFVC